MPLRGRCVGPYDVLLVSLLWTLYSVKMDEKQISKVPFTQIATCNTCGTIFFSKLVSSQVVTGAKTREWEAMNRAVMGGTNKSTPTRCNG